MGACGCDLSYMALNGLIIRGLWLTGHLPGIGDTRAWVPTARVCAELGRQDVLDWADRWQDPAHPRPL
jgi:hypothetical protein